MSVYLEAVAQAREHRQDAEAAFRNALKLAHQHHSLREIAPHAGLTYSGVAWLLKDGESDLDKAERLADASNGGDKSVPR